MKKTIISAVALSMMASAAMAEGPSVREQLWMGIKSGTLNAVEAADNYVVDPVVDATKATGSFLDDNVVDPVVDGSKYVGGKVADGAKVAGSAVATGAVATANGVDYTFNLTSGIWKAGVGEMQGMSKIGGGLAALVLTPVLFTMDVLDLVIDGAVHAGKQLDKVDGQ